MNGWNDKQIFSEIKGKLKAIRKNIGKYYPDGLEKSQEIKEQKTMVDKIPKIFISHSSKDKAYVTQIVTLLDGMGLKQTQFFAVCFLDMVIPIDTNIKEVFIDTPNNITANFIKCIVVKNTKKL